MSSCRYITLEISRAVRSGSALTRVIGSSARVPADENRFLRAQACTRQWHQASATKAFPAIPRASASRACNRPKRSSASAGPIFTWPILWPIHAPALRVLLSSAPVCRSNSEAFPGRHRFPFADREKTSGGVFPHDGRPGARAIPKRRANLPDDH